MAPLFADEEVWQYDVIALQEPWANPFQRTTYHPVKDRFDLVYNIELKTRVCFFISSRLRGAWSYTHHTPDLSTLHLQIQEDEVNRTIHVHNLYNPIDHTGEERDSTLPDLRKALETDKDGEHLVLGDFPAGGADRCTHLIHLPQV
jgi:hypothetical protein